MNNQQKRLAARGGRRRPTTSYRETISISKTVNASTGQNSLDVDKDGNYVVRPPSRLGGVGRFQERVTPYVKRVPR